MTKLFVSLNLNEICDTHIASTQTPISDKPQHFYYAPHHETIL